MSKRYREYDHRKIREARARLKAQKRGKSYGPSKFGLRMRWWKPVNTQRRRVRLIPSVREEGAALNTSAFVENYQTTIKNSRGWFRQVVCNCHDGTKDVPCVSCHYAVEEDNGDLLPSFKRAITVLDESEFHEVPKEGKNGNTWNKYERCEKPNDPFSANKCENCKEGYETKFGRRFYWNLGWGHYDQLMAQLEDIANECASCGETIKVVYFSCPSCNPEGDESKAVWDVRDEDCDEDLEEIFKNETVSCPHCDESVKMVEHIACLKDEGDSFSAGCENPVRLSPWDCSLWLKSEGSGSSTSIKITEHLPCEPNPKLEENGSEDNILEPLPLADFLGVMKLEEQAKLLERDNPFTEEDEKLLLNQGDPNQEDAHSAPR
jgi:hypothetical protein